METRIKCRIPSKRKSFEVKSYYQVLSTLVWFTFPWKSNWKVKIPSRVAFFVWTATLGKILALAYARGNVFFDKSKYI